MEVLERARAVTLEGRAFALVTVVRALAPTSAKPGDKALLTLDGEWMGWVGGSCAEPTARRAALEAMQDGRCRLIHLTNDDSEPSRVGVERVPMSCYSGGTLELYVEPHLPEPDLIVFGGSPVARELCRLGEAMRYRVQKLEVGVEAEVGGEAALGGEAGPAPAVTCVGSTRQFEVGAPGRTFVVVASHGRGEDEALDWALSTGVAYVGLVASRRRADAVRERLQRRGVSPALVASIDAPAGLDIGARAPEEVALSVLAEMVRRRRGATRTAWSEAWSEASSEALGEVAAAASEKEPGGKSCCGGPRRESEAAPGGKSCCGGPRRESDAAPAGRLSGGGPRPVSFAAVVLAAGMSRRMGERNKLLLPVDGQPMIRRSVEAVLGAGVDQVVVVVGHQAEAVEQALRPLAVTVAHNPDFASGQVSSVRVGLAALAPTDAVIMCLGDQPSLGSADLVRLEAAFAGRTSGDVLVPTFDGKRGNPVVLSWEVCQETLRRGVHYGCRRFMDENSDRVAFWESGSEDFIRDVDRPADYGRLVAIAST